MLENMEKVLGRLIDMVGKLLAGVLILMVLNVAYDVLMRYLFRASSVGMQELEWHLFSVIILYGVGVALKHEAHVRVDFLYDRMQPKTRAVINICGTVLFLMPISLLIFFGSFDFVADAYVSGEISEDPGGVTHRWIIKSMIPASFGFLVLCAVSYIIQNVNGMRRSS